MNDQTPDVPEAREDAEQNRPASLSGSIPEVESAKEFARTYGVQLAVGIGLALVIIGGFSWYRSNKAAGEAKAAEMLSAARSAKQIEEVIKQYPSALAAQTAMLQLAKTYYDSGNYGMASTAYSDFESKYPKHPMVDVARLGKIHCQEATGQSEEALAGFEAFLKSHTNHFLSAVATFGKARTLEQMGQLTEARAVYEDYMAANPESPRRADAETELAAIDRKLKSQPKAN